MSGRWDGQLGAWLFRLVRSEEFRGYSNQLIRPTIESQQLGASALQTRADQPGFLQSSWSKGSAWWVPKLEGEELNSYGLSERVDTWSEPGNVVPVNNRAAVTDANLSVVARPYLADGAVHSLGVTSTVNASYLDFYTWNGSGWTVGGHTTGAALAYGTLMGGVFELTAGGSTKVWYHQGGTYPAGKVGNFNAAGFTFVVNTTQYPGAILFPHNGFPWYYDGNVMWRCNDPHGTPVFATIADDGFGPDWLETTAVVDAPAVYWYINLAASTPEGIYYVKNVRGMGGTVAPYVFRLEVDGNGEWTNYPIATLDEGSAALSIRWHQGSLMISTTSDLGALYEGATDFQVSLHHVSGGNIGLVGVPLGGEVLDEGVWKFLGAQGPLLYVGGHSRVWVYDAVRGGMSPLYTHGLGGVPGPLVSAVDASARSGVLFGRGTTYHHVPDQKYELPETVGSFNVVNRTKNWLESGYFDFGVPMERKTVSSVSVQSDVLSANQRWTVELQADDGAWVVVADHSGGAYSETSFTPITGYRFRYRLYYQTTDATQAAFKAVAFKSTVGELINAWELVVDGTEFGNVENEVVDPEQVVADLRSAAASGTELSYKDFYGGYEADAGDTYTVKIQSARIDKGEPAESMISLTLLEV